jgi:hypothetical protein
MRESAIEVDIWSAADVVEFEGRAVPRRRLSAARSLAILGVLAVTACAPQERGVTPDTPQQTGTQSTSTTLPSSTSTTVDTTAALELVGEALGILRSEAYVSDRVDWPVVGEEARQATESAGTIDEVYRSISTVVDAVARIDGHSFFVPAPQTAAVLYDPPPPPEPRTDRLGRVGYVWVGEYGGVDPVAIAKYAQRLQGMIAGLDAEGVCGWVVDLWDHGGGNMSPGLAGLAPLVGDGPVVQVIDPRGTTRLWTVDGPELRFDGHLQVRVDDRYMLSDAELPVGVVIGPQTASSGEALVLALRGRPNTRLFGHLTRGLATNNSTFELSDGSVIVLTTGLVADRDGDAPGMGSVIRPDELVPALPEHAPAVAAAAAWVEQQPACGS